MKKIWEFLPKASKMSLMTNTFHNVLTSSGFSEEERLVREALQNSTDAHSADTSAPVSVIFDNPVLVGASKSALVNALSLHSDIRDRRRLLGLHSPNAIETIGDPSIPLRTLTISDYHTTGLTGVWNGTDKDDHFGRLVVNLGLDDKPDSDRPSGGSFGFGKTVYAKSSRVGIVAFYSVFRPSPATDNVHARFMATGLFRPHQYDGELFTGFAFHGHPAPDSGEALPFTNDAAHQLASDCGLAIRSPEKTGTTVLIVDCNLDIFHMRRAAEKYWWPRLIRSELDVAFVADGETTYPRPRGNRVLKPFLHAIRNLDSNYEERPKSRLYPSRRVRQSSNEMKSLGHLSCVLLEGESELRNHVALIRQPGMVVEYIRCGSDSFEECVAVFRGHTDVEAMLTYSEPQIHNTWDPNSDRLKNKFGDDGPHTISSVLSFIRRKFTDFQRSQEPPIPRDGVDARHLSKLLGRFLQLPGAAPPRPVSDPRPVSLSIQERRVQGEDKTYDVADFSISLRPEVAIGEVDCVVVVTHEVLGDASERIVDRSMVELFSGTASVAHGNPARHHISVCEDGPTRLQARAVSSPLYVARLRIAIEAV